MSTGQLVLLDHGVAVLTAALWVAAGGVAAAGRTRLALWLAAAGVLAVAGRLVLVAVLADRGWWFVQEKVLLGVPLLVVTVAAAGVLAGRPLLRGRAPLPPGAVTALFAAGYAALAGFVVTYVGGYPLTWSVALFALAGVGGAVLVTAQALTPAPTAAGPAVSRRRFLAIAAGAAGAAGVGLAFVRAPSADAGGGVAAAHPAGHGTPVTDLRGATTPAAGGTVRPYTVTARTATVALTSGHEVDAWTYDGTLPGPPLTAVQGDLVEVTLRNEDVDEGVTIHWHGYDVACGEDGAPGTTQDVVGPGAEFGYRFRADQAGTFWYHTHQVSHVGVRRGLYGTLVVAPRDAAPEDVDLAVPVHTYDGVLAIGDDDGVLDQAAEPGASVRLRLLNTDSEPHRFGLAGTAFRLAAVDGRDLNGPGEVSERALRLPAGGRYDVVFTMPDGPVALTVDGEVRLRLGGGDDDPATSGWAELDPLHYGEPADVPFTLDTTFDRHFTMVLDRGAAMVDGRPAFAQTVNGRGHPSIPEQVVAEGDLVRFTVVNRSLETHPWHLHGHGVLVLARDGQAATGSPLWVDTFDVRPGEVWDVAFEAGNPGVWMNHCHNLPHADQGMMLRLRYDGVAAMAGGHGHAAH
ncbi:multicopper oxidase family protein [Jiangella alkaliphila]|uniref:Multicopper oxidase with three cupredoxin domains (Includes cell division protein FtsP and spore coat protein CotA) n=1 Tax=Jiangella alkaliphila TaxID=419479 RepID=A0A1H2KZ22_9ACTN|nr:multicopper oxidase family protein [Jiangella alkaliphila]SDU74037.1 Multicopper oxidase with three cupredoxin domains (includes cell division protein FtsP and spore coat protein CotA) [Jiangella alkaliphila]